VLRITVELLPGGQETGRRQLAMANVSQMEALAGKFDYVIAVYANEGDNPVAGSGRWESRGMIAAHVREQSVWALVARAAAWAACEAEKRA
jgi:hypothetical protein